MSYRRSSFDYPEKRCRRATVSASLSHPPAFGPCRFARNFCSGRPIASAIGAGSLQRQIVNLVEHGPEQHLAVAAGNSEQPGLHLDQIRPHGCQLAQLGKLCHSFPSFGKRRPDRAGRDPDSAGRGATAEGRQQDRLHHGSRSPDPSIQRSWAVAVQARRS
jgi:hypothetical protein